MANIVKFDENKYYNLNKKVNSEEEERIPTFEEIEREFIKKETKKAKFLEKYENNLLNYDKIINPPKLGDPILYIGDTRVYPDSITLISGNAGRGKSAFLGAMLAAILMSGRKTDLRKTIHCRSDILIDQDRPIIWIDTEREEKVLYKSLNQVWARTDLTEEEFRSLSENVMYFCIANLSISERINFVFQCFEELDASMIFLDGIGDLVSDINDSEKTYNLVDKLNSYCRKYKTNLFCTLHTNAAKDGGSDSKPRGHLGSYILQKASVVAVISGIKGHPKLFEVNTEDGFGKSRSGGGNKIAYTYSDELNMFVGTDMPDTEKPMKKIHVAKFSDERILEMWQLNFAGRTKVLYKDEFMPVFAEYFDLDSKQASQRAYNLTSKNKTRKNPKFTRFEDGTIAINIPIPNNSS